VGDTTAVNGHPAGVSPDGALDMAGNAYEWVNDWFDPDYYAASPESNPQGPATGTQKILRGGGWDGTRSQIAVWRRNNVAPTYMSDDAGIRCAADP
jgi:formylglycine-generating enzyme required for sulfatase activity